MDSEQADNRPTAARTATAVAVCLGLLLVVAFVWRVVFYMNALSTGTLDPASLSFVDQFTAARAAAGPQAGTADISSKDAASTGPEDAVLTIVQFADFECPYSRQVSASVRALALQYQDRVRVEFRHLPIAELHPTAVQAAEASECARAQGKFWEYHDKLFANQTEISPANLSRFATEIGLDRGAFDRCMVAGAGTARVKADLAVAAETGIIGTPTFFFNGVPVQGAIPADILAQLVKRYVP